MSITDLASFKRDKSPDDKTLQEWLNWQEQLHFTAIELGLDRCRKVADSMRLLPPSYFVISIAGTNGKGSCAVLLESILREAGYKTGLYNSPHLTRYNERIRINGQEVEDHLLCNSFSKINLAREKITLTYFEFGTLAAMDLFNVSDIDIAIMEVGMGGRLDAVNMLDANVAIISNIDIDHERWLGSDREAIGREKSGIFRPMRPAICGDPDPPDSISHTANLVGANLLQVGNDFNYKISDKNWTWSSGATKMQNLPVPAGNDYQVQNASAVLMALHTMEARYPVSQKAILNGMSKFYLPGRFQVVKDEVSLIFDVAHNRQSASILSKNLSKFPNKKRILMVLAMLMDKNHEAFISELMAGVDKWYLSGLDEGRGASVNELEKVFLQNDFDTEYAVFDKLEEAFSSVKSESRPGDIIVISGSFVTVGLGLNYFNIKN